MKFNNIIMTVFFMSLVSWNVMANKDDLFNKIADNYPSP